jgi:hypothetical protein
VSYGNISVSPSGDHAAQRRRDEATWQDPGGDLIQQRLEQVVIGPVHDRDGDISAGQGTCHPDSAEPATDDDYLVPSLAHDDSISGRGFPGEHPGRSTTWKKSDR